MPRRSRNETPAPEPASETPATQPAEPKPFTTKSHSDGDVRIPKEVREVVKISGHQSFIVEILENTETSFTLKFTRS